jgi:tetratricopeptide (TPR) repeat protein
MTSQDYLPSLLQSLQADEPAAAIARLQQAAQQYMHDARPLLLVAAAHAQAGQTDQAEASYIAALQRAPDLAIARFQLGLLQFSAGRPAAALATWAPFDSLGPDQPLRLFRDALACLAQDRFDEAIALFQQGMAANRDNPALNGDMQRFVDAINRLPGRQPSGAGQEAAPSAADGQTGGEHFFLSAYRHMH